MIATEQDVEQRERPMDLDSDLETAVRRIAGKQDRSVESVVADAIRQYVDRMECWTDFLADAEASWQDYRLTGLHLTGDELVVWLQGWGKGGETATPSCHD